MTTGTISILNGPLGFMGKLSVYENGRYLWSEGAQIHRLTKEDAIQDAKNMAKDAGFII